ncbi:MAG: hypothetical protein J6C42_00555, partial [Clostridia bacterium]|nr:hypothetical protein [Clostridia bacterium]
MRKVSPKPSSKPFKLWYWGEFVQELRSNLHRCIKVRYSSPEKIVRELVTSPQRDIGLNFFVKINAVALGKIRVPRFFNNFKEYLVNPPRMCYNVREIYP